MRWLVLFLAVALTVLQVCRCVPATTTEVAAARDSETLHETVRAYLDSGGRELYQRHMDLKPGIEYNPLAHFSVDHAPTWHSTDRTSDLEILRAMRLHVPGVDSESTIAEAGKELMLKTTERQWTQNVDGTLSSYQVKFEGRPPAEIRNAFLFAIRIWARTFPCAPRLTVTFVWKIFESIDGNSEPGTLAAAVAPFSVVGGGGNGLQLGVSYTPTMATCISGRDFLQNNNGEHIKLLFNARQQWWTNVNKDAPYGRFDFATVALHELCHGLFFTGALHVKQGSANVLYQSQNSLPARFDQFIQMSNGIGIARSCNQRELYHALTRRGLSFRTSEESSTFGLFAPEIYRPGSSTYHLDGDGLKQSCARYAISGNDCSDLMTFELNPGYTQHAIGEPVLRIMRSILGNSAGLVASSKCTIPAPLNGPTGQLGSLHEAVNVGPFRVKRWVIIVACAVAAVGAALVIFFIATAVCCKR